MKIQKSMLVISTVVVLGLLLTSCSTAGTTATSWGSVSLSGNVVIYADGMQVYALKSENGNTLWTYPEKGSATRLFLAQPLIVEDQVIVGDFAKNLISLDFTSGKENWLFNEADSKYLDSPLLVDDILVAPNADGTLYALDLNGNLKWSFKAQSAFWAQPVSDGMTVFAPNMDHNLYAVDVKTGNEKWKIDLGSALVARPTLADGVVYLGTLEGQFFAIDTKTQKKLWEQTIKGGIWSAPYLQDGMLYFGDQQGNVNILNATTGNIVESVNLDSAVLGAGAVLSDGILYGNEKGELVLIGFDGSRKWTRSVNGSIYSSLAVNGDQIAVIAYKGEKPLIAMDINGNEIWYFTLK